MTQDLSPFSSFVLSLASSASYYLGDVPEEVHQKVEINLDIAKHNIDLLALLKEKTTNNLTPMEQQMLDDLLYKLRIKFIEKSK